MGGETRVASEAGIVVLSATPSQRGVVPGVCNKLHVLAEYTTGRDETRVRPDYELAIVLDKSGSMAGSKLTGAKKAISHVIEMLGERDVLHLVAYDSGVQTVFAHANAHSDRPRLLELLNGVRAGSSTNMGQGLEKAMQLFDSPASASASTRRKRVFLFSDGCVNEGAKGADLIRIVSDLFANGVQTTSFGIGSDFDEALMKSIAEHGNGDYAFLDREKHIHKYVEKSLRSLLGTIGTAGRLTGRGRNGAIVRSILGHEDAVRGADIGDIRENNVKQVLFEVEVMVADASATPCIDFALTYHQTRDPLAPYASIEVTLGLAVMADAELALGQTEEHKRVAVALEIFRAADEDDRVLQLLDQHKVDEAIAVKSASVDRLKLMSPHDTTGFIEACVHRGTKTIAKMMSRESVPQMRKCVDYEAEMGRALSACSIGYDSDSGSVGEEEMPVARTHGLALGNYSDISDSDSSDSDGGGSVVGHRRRVHSPVAVASPPTTAQKVKKLLSGVPNVFRRNRAASVDSGSDMDD